MRGTSWGKAVDELRRSAQIPLNELARKTDLHRTALSRYLSGHRSPDDSTKAALINKVLAELLNQAEVAPYLDVLYAIERVDEGLPDVAIDDALEMFQLAFSLYLRPEAASELVQQLSDLDKARTRKLLLALSSIERRHLIRHIRGVSAPQQIWFDEVRGVCLKYGVDLRQWLRSERDLQETRELDAFLLALQKALLVIADPVERLQSERQIIVAAIRYAAASRAVQKGKK